MMEDPYEMLIKQGTMKRTRSGRVVYTVQGYIRAINRDKEFIQKKEDELKDAIADLTETWNGYEASRLMNDIDDVKQVASVQNEMVTASDKIKELARDITDGWDSLLDDINNFQKEYWHEFDIWVTHGAQ